jgi:hypothetical protein
MDARYEGPTLSRFLSQNPMFIQGGPAVADGAREHLDQQREIQKSSAERGRLGAAALMRAWPSLGELSWAI